MDMHAIIMEICSLFSVNRSQRTYSIAQINTFDWLEHSAIEKPPVNIRGKVQNNNTIVF